MPANLGDDDEALLDLGANGCVPWVGAWWRDVWHTTRCCAYSVRPATAAALSPSPKPHAAGTIRGLAHRAAPVCIAVWLGVRAAHGTAATPLSEAQQSDGVHTTRRLDDDDGEQESPDETKKRWVAPGLLRAATGG